MTTSTNDSLTQLETQFETLFETDFGEDPSSELEEIEATASTPKLAVKDLQRLNQLLKDHEALKSLATETGGSDSVISHYSQTTLLIKKMINVIGENSIMGTIAADPEFTYFTQLIFTANRENQLLDSTAPYTVFAPRDEDLIKKITEDAIAGVLKDPNLADEIVKNHIITGNVSSADMNERQQAKMISGEVFAWSGIEQGKTTGYIDGIQFHKHSTPPINSSLYKLDGMLTSKNIQTGISKHRAHAWGSCYRVSQPSSQIVAKTVLLNPPYAKYKKSEDYDDTWIGHGQSDGNLTWYMTFAGGEIVISESPPSERRSIHYHNSPGEGSDITDVTSLTYYTEVNGEAEPTKNQLQVKIDRVDCDI